MNANTSAPDDETKGGSHDEAARRRIDILLLALTLLSVAVYWPSLRVVTRVVRAGHPLGISFLTPMIFVIVGLCMVLLWCWRGVTRRGRLAWAVFVTLGMLGWPTTCLYAALAVLQRSAHSSLIHTCPSPGLHEREHIKT